MPACASLVRRVPIIRGPAGPSAPARLVQRAHFPPLQEPTPTARAHCARQDSTAIRQWRPHRATLARRARTVRILGRSRRTLARCVHRDRLHIPQAVPTLPSVFSAVPATSPRLLAPGIAHRALPGQPARRTARSVSCAARERTPHHQAVPACSVRQAPSLPRSTRASAPAVPLARLENQRARYPRTLVAAPAPPAHTPPGPGQPTPRCARGVRRGRGVPPWAPTRQPSASPARLARIPLRRLCLRKPTAFHAPRVAQATPPRRQTQLCAPSASAGTMPPWGARIARLARPASTRRGRGRRKEGVNSARWARTSLTLVPTRASRAPPARRVPSPPWTGARRSPTALPVPSESLPKLAVARRPANATCAQPGSSARR